MLVELDGACSCFIDIGKIVAEGAYQGNSDKYSMT